MDTTANENEGAAVKAANAIRIHGAHDCRPVDGLVPYARNSRTHSEEQLEQLAESITEWGFTMPVLVDEAGGIIAGHGRVMAARRLGMAEVPVIVASGWTDAQRRAYVIADNKLALNAGWDMDMLAAELRDLGGEGFDLGLTGFDGEELLNMLGDLDGDDEEDAEKEEGPPPEPEKVAISRTGDVWLCGGHRVMCGSSTNAADVRALMGGHKAQLLHADPPYGMGKEADGVANDNLTGDDLDRFQMDWWRVYRRHLVDNAGAYVWGNAPDLWRLWFKNGLGDSEPMTLRNEIVWDKKSIAGMASPDLTQYPEASERCLYFQLGRYVFQVNQTKEDFWPGWEPLREWMCAQRDAMGWKASDVKRVVGNQMYSHWFSQSQWVFVSAKDYTKLQAAAGGRAFVKPYAELREEYDQARAIFRGEVLEPRGEAFRAGRPYFDNAHEPMRDVWEFSRVTGEERHTHATPKPVLMMERVMKSSLPAGGICAEPFGGSGSTLMGAHKTGRLCFSMELQPVYVDVIVKRWQNYSEEEAILEATGQGWAEVQLDREAAAAALSDTSVEEVAA